MDEGALGSGKVGDVSLDVFSKEAPSAGFPLFASDGVLATPHVGGSTEEAQEIVGVRIAEQVVEYLFARVPGSVSWDVAAAGPGTVAR